MFSETRYARNGDLRVAYRASPEGRARHRVRPGVVQNCEDIPEQPSIQGWIEAMTSLGRLIFFDQPGTGASDPVTSGALPTVEQWADSITAVLDDLGSREAVLVAVPGAVATGALFAATHPSRTTALVVLEGYANPMAERTEGTHTRGNHCRLGRHMGDGRVPACDESGHAVERGDPGSVGTHRTPGGEPRNRRPHAASAG